MEGVVAHETVGSAEGDQSEKEEGGKKREEDHSPLGFPPFATHGCGKCGWGICSLTVDTSAHNGVVCNDEVGWREVKREVKREDKVKV